MIFDFDKIENKMKEIIERNEDFVRHEVSKEEALKMFANEPYKCELINELPENEYYLLVHKYILNKYLHVILRLRHPKSYPHQNHIKLLFCHDLI